MESTISITKISKIWQYSTNNIIKGVELTLMLF